jgi:prepilin signal peptidase PulO-like enzyme (type II secretory pathway)
MLEPILGAVFFGLASYVGVLLAGTISATPFDDGPQPAEPPVAWIIAGAFLIGFFALAHAAEPRHIVMDAIVVCALSAIWCTDVRYGIVPDVFTLVPLLIVVGAGLLNGDPWPLISAFIAFVPFACLAIVSKGVGMGWGDVKLAALGGAVLGGETALLAFAIGAVVAVLWAYRRGRQKQVIAFAPFLAGAIAIAMPLATV